jgi:hypothetical protein
MRHDLKKGDRVTVTFAEGNAPDGVKGGIEATVVQARDRSGDTLVRFDEPGIELA